MNDTVAESGASRMARVVVEDSVRHSYKHGNGLSEIAAALAMLEDPGGIEMVRAMLDQYSTDLRVYEDPKHWSGTSGARICAADLREALIVKVREFVDGSDEFRTEYLGSLGM